MLPTLKKEKNWREVKLYNFIQKTRMLIYKCNDIFNLIENNTLCEYKCGATDVFNTYFAWFSSHAICFFQTNRLHMSFLVTSFQRPA